MSNDAIFTAKLERSAGFLQQDYLPDGAAIPERVIYSALPGIVLSSTALTATQGRVLAVDGKRNTTVYADLVYVVGKIVAPGRNIKIVARKLVFIGDGAEIVTDGNPGSQPVTLAADAKPARAADGRSARIAGGGYSFDGGWNADNGKAGLTADARDQSGHPLISDGASGGNGTDAGSIEIDVEKWVGKCVLSARGGDGGAAQDGQNGQDAGNGGDGVDGTVTYSGGGNSASARDLRPPGSGARGGDAGLGGAGGAGGNAGTVQVRAVRAFRCECEKKGDHSGCTGTVNSVDCAACSAIGATELNTLATLKTTGGALGKHGANGAPGIGGLSGQAVNRDFGNPIALEIIRKGDSDVRHGGRIGLKSTEASLGSQQVFGVFGNGIYYWNDDFDTDKQSWKIERVNGVGDGKIRFGDKVLLTNCSYGTKLIESNGYLSAGSYDQTWVLESPTSDRAGTVINIGDRVLFNHGDGSYVSGAYGGTSYWFATVRKVKPARTRADSGIVRSKPAGSDPWKDHTKGKDQVSAPAVLPASELCDHWDPAQVWLQIERLKGQYLTLDLGGAEYTRFGDELLRWNSLLAPLARDKALTATADTAGSKTPTDWKVQELVGALTKIAGMLGNYSQNCDYFGNQLDYAPNPAFPYYANELTRTLADLKTFEDHYSKLFKEGVANNDFKLAADAAFNEATATITVAKAQLEKSKLDFLDSQQRLRDENSRVVALKAPFAEGQPHVEAFKAEIMSPAQFNCDLSQILGALEMMVFAPPVETHMDQAGTPSRGLSGPGALMAGAQLAKFIKYGVDTIKTVDGETLERANVLTSVRQLDKDVFASAKDIFTTSRGQKYDIGGPGLLATLDRWEKLVDQFINLESAKALEHDIRALTDAVRVRGDAITDFNSKLMDVLFLASVISDNEDTRTKSLAAAANLNDPAMPAALSFLARHHQARKDAVIEMVYLANRAYANWMLDDGTAMVPAKDRPKHGSNVFREVIVASDPWDNKNVDVYGAIDWAVLETCKTKLEEWFRSDIGKHSGDPQPFGSSEESGLVISIADAGVIKRFQNIGSYGSKKNVHIAAVTITEHGLGGTFSNEHLKGFWDTRLTALRVFLNGAFREPGHGDERIQIQFIHDSSDQYFTEKGALRTFSRPQLDPKTFIYNGAKGAERYVRDAKGLLTDRFVDAYIEMDGLIGSATPGNFAADDKNARYAGIGPFTLWTILVDPKQNPGLNLTELTSIELQLVGIARTRKA
jgi:hypothetical protein